MASFLATFYLLETLDSLIKRQNTGNCQCLAQRLEISERSLFRLMRDLKVIVGRDRVKIRYDKERDTYYYDPSGYFFNPHFQQKIPENL